MKTLLIGLFSGVLLAACGGAPEELENTAAPAVAPELVAVSAPSEGPGDISAQWTANCAGWESGARTCSWKCRSSSEWLWATQSVSYGQCGAYADDFCGHAAYKACWSSNKPSY
ncbi:hypothetical protein [Stigmatella aurantiaca]|uniref:Lipoprotein n=1 Tax=Stigmatella aurantiaca (strain DW4/3-1) TaxID=378806 RepID=E3FMF9_STIAD|nr:hypothetical protein [Stigmatella aurantiaca]ADO70552.1 uncharacterized protein STAUR_2754 [Stigmatella aurantiaca DW4/3-1]